MTPVAHHWQGVAAAVGAAELWCRTGSEALGGRTAALPSRGRSDWRLGEARARLVPQRLETRGRPAPYVRNRLHLQ